MIDEKKFNILRGIVMTSYLSNEEKREMLGFLTELSEQPKADWISCETEMPKEEYVTCWIAVEVEQDKPYYYCCAVWTNKDGFQTHDIEAHGKIVAWQKVQPYKKEGAE